MYSSPHIYKTRLIFFFTNKLQNNISFLKIGSLGSEALAWDSRAPNASARLSEVPFSAITLAPDPWLLKKYELISSLP